MYDILFAMKTITKGFLHLMIGRFERVKSVAKI